MKANNSRKATKKAMKAKAAAGVPVMIPMKTAMKAKAAKPAKLAPMVSMKSAASVEAGGTAVKAKNAGGEIVSKLMKSQTTNGNEGKVSMPRGSSDEGNQEGRVLGCHVERVLQNRVHDLAAQLVSAVASLGSVATLQPLPSAIFEYGLTISATPQPGGALISVLVGSTHIKASYMAEVQSNRAKPGP